MQCLPRPEDGLLIYGLFLEGACWDKQRLTLVRQRMNQSMHPSTLARYALSISRIVSGDEKIIC